MGWPLTRNPGTYIHVGVAICPQKTSLQHTEQKHHWKPKRCVGNVTHTQTLVSNTSKHEYVNGSFCLEPITTYKHPTQSNHKGLGTIVWWHSNSLQHLRSSNTQLIGWWAKLSGILHQRPYKAGFEVLHNKKRKKTVCLSHNSVQTDVSCQPVSMQSCFLGEIMGNHDFLLSGALSTNQHFTRCTNSLLFRWLRPPEVWKDLFMARRVSSSAWKGWKVEIQRV